MERRLAAILAADLVGYSRLMGVDETGTLARLTELRQGFLEPLIAEHRGRIVKLMGDGLLIEFASVVDALTCAVAWQKGVAELQEAMAHARRFSFRIGINIGDVIIEGDDIYGDGVNVASRLEGLAEPGGICVARNVYEQVKSKMDLAFRDLGERPVKNVAEPVQTWQVLIDRPSTNEIPMSPVGLRRSRLPIVVTGLLLSLITLGALVWWAPWVPREESASVEAMAFPLPEKPSIAVLPFNNMSEDQGQEYFVDGMTEDLITDLSKISALFVIARNSSFSYKGQQVKVRQVAEELGVRYVLEGSVRRAGNEVRINAQLIDATTGGHLWAERYDGTLEDIFDLQDSVTEKIVAALAVSLTGEEKAQRAHQGTENVQAHDAYLQGWARYKLQTPEAYEDAVSFFEEATRLDPAYSHAHAALAALYWEVLKNDWAYDLDMPSSRAEELANGHLEEALKDPVPLAHVVQSKMFASFGTFSESFYDDAVAEAEKAVALDGNDAAALAGLAEALARANRPAEALERIEQAIRLDPHHPPSYLTILGSAQFGMEVFDAAAETLERAVKRSPDSEPTYIHLASAYGHLGRIEEADDVIDRVNGLRNAKGEGELSLRDSREFAIEPYDNWIDFPSFGAKAVQDRLRAGLKDLPLLKWQYLLTVHVVIGPGNDWFEVDGVKQISIETAKSLYDNGVTFIDASLENVWKAGHLPGAVHLPYANDGNRGGARFKRDALREVANLDDEIVLYYRATETHIPAWEAAKAVSWGYKNVYMFQGGAKAWKEAGYPVESAE